MVISLTEEVLLNVVHFVDPIFIVSKFKGLCVGESVQFHLYVCV